MREKKEVNFLKAFSYFLTLQTQDEQMAKILYSLTFTDTSMYSTFNCVTISRFIFNEYKYMCRCSIHIYHVGFNVSNGVSG